MFILLFHPLQLFGLFDLKLSTAIILCGGVKQVTDSGTKIRGESNLLIIGDPGI